MQGHEFTESWLIPICTALGAIAYFASALVKRKLKGASLDEEEHDSLLVGSFEIALSFALLGVVFIQQDVIGSEKELLVPLTIGAITVFSKAVRKLMKIVGPIAAADKLLSIGTALVMVAFGSVITAIGFLSYYGSIPQKQWQLEKKMPVPAKEEDHERCSQANAHNAGSD
jgi:hypothetical protein